jgi:hypothetical protein
VLLTGLATHGAGGTGAVEGVGTKAQVSCSEHNASSMHALLATSFTASYGLHEPGGQPCHKRLQLAFTAGGWGRPSGCCSWTPHAAGLGHHRLMALGDPWLLPIPELTAPSMLLLAPLLFGCGFAAPGAGRVVLLARVCRRPVLHRLPALHHGAQDGAACPVHQAVSR